MTKNRRSSKHDWGHILNNAFTCVWTIGVVALCIWAAPIFASILFGILLLLWLIFFYGIIKPMDKDLRRLEELRTKEDRTPEEEKEYCDKYIYWENMHYL